LLDGEADLDKTNSVGASFIPFGTKPAKAKGLKVLAVLSRPRSPAISPVKPAVIVPILRFEGALSTRYRLNKPDQNLMVGTCPLLIRYRSSTGII
jgi:hypothetical protein